MNKYYAYYGYVHNDEELEQFGPTHKIKEFNNIDDLKRFHKEFLEETDGMDIANIEFRIFEGEERKMVPIEKVIEYDLE